MTTFSGYRVIMADPPWKYGNPRALVGNGGRGAQGGRVAQLQQVDVDAHYSTLPVDKICQMRVADLVDSSGCMLFLWVTNPFLCDGSGTRVVKAWGFEPKTVLTWGKVQQDGLTPSMKTGHWFRSASEHCIVGVRGQLKRPRNFPALPTWQPRQRLEHSVKPEMFHEYAEQAAPEGPWLELFARRARPNWYVWGNQAPDSIAWDPWSPISAEPTGVALH